MGKSNLTREPGAWALFMYLAIVLISIGGYVANIVKIVGAISEPLTTLMIVRLVGVFVGPLGIIMGFF